MSTLHCSSTSLGYMKPSTPGIITRSLSHCSIQVFVVDLGLGCHIWLQYLYLVVAQKLVHRVLGIFEIHQLAGAGGAVLAARRSQSLGDAVVTQGAFIDCVGFGMQIAAAIGARLHAVTAAQAVGLID